MTSIVDKPREDLDLDEPHDFELPCEVVHGATDGEIFLTKPCGLPACWAGAYICHHGEPQSVLACDPCKCKLELIERRDGLTDTITWTRL